MQRIFIFLAYFFICVTAFSQQPNLSFQHYTTQDGLSDNYIFNLFQDNRGFIWISTQEGLNRFDGRFFRKFYHLKDNPSSLLYNATSEIIHSSSNELAINSNFRLSVFNLQSQKFNNPVISALNDRLLGLCLEDKGMLWFCFQHRLIQTDSLFRINREILIDPQIVKWVSKIYRLPDNRLVAVASNGIFYVNESTGSLQSFNEAFPELNKYELYFSYSFFKEDENILYAGGWTTGLFKFDFNAGTFRDLQSVKSGLSPLKGKPINSVLKDSKNRLWVASLDGLFLMDETTGHCTLFTESKGNDGIVANSVTCLLEDDEKNIWVGTSKGLNKLSEASQIIRYFSKEFEKNRTRSEIYDVTKLKNKDVIIATYGNGLYRMQESSGSISVLPQPFMTHTWFVNEINDQLFVSGHEQLIVAPTDNYLFRKTNFLDTFYKNANLVLLAYKDRAGDMWYSLNEGGGLIRYIASGKKYVQYKNEQAPQPFPHNYFNMVAEDEEGNLWWGVNKFQTLVKWDRQKETFSEIDLRLLLHQSEKVILGINCLYYEKGGKLWIGTDGSGLFELDIKTLQVKEYTISDGLVGEYLTLIIVDKKKRLWIGTRKGLSCLQPDRKSFINYTLNDGLPEILFNDGVCYYDSLENKLYLGTQHSLLVFNPDELVSRSLGHTRIYLDEIFINGIKYDDVNQKSLRLKYDQNNLQFNFSAIEFNNASSLQLEYRLEGLNKEWVDAGNQRSVTFLNLDNGKYVFKLRSKKRGINNWNEITATFPIVILPPLWQTWWFRTGAGLLITGLLIIIIRSYYRRRLEQQKALLDKQQAVEKERGRIASDMHDDLGAGLTKIKFITENINEKFHSGESVLPELQKLKSSSSELVESMGEIIWAMSEKNNRLRDTLYYLRSYAANYCEENDLSCHFELPERFNNEIVSGNIRRNIFLLLKECLHNIVKHAGAKTVNIKASVSQNLELTVKDDGKGFSENEITIKGNGLINMRKRVQELNGTLVFENRNGTSITIRFPLNPNKSTIE